MRLRGYFFRAIVWFFCGVILLVSLASCGNLTRSGNDSMIHFRKQINHALPEYYFELSGEDAKDPGVCRYALSIYDPTADTDDAKGKLLQIFSFTAAPSEMPFSFQDLNFDGSLDLIIFVGHGAGATGTLEVYPWYDGDSFSVFSDIRPGFLLSPMLSFSGVRIETFDDTRQFVVTDRLLGEETIRMLWQAEQVNGYNNSCNRTMLRKLRRETFTWNPATDKTECRIYQLIDGAWTLIYESDDADSDSGKALACLRYGVTEPIEVSQAMEQVIALAPNVTISELEYKGLRTIGGKTYYVIADANGRLYGVPTFGGKLIIFDWTEK